MWGPYSSAVLPGLWLLEGGQSAAGKLVDHIIDTHPASAEAKRMAGHKSVYCYLEEVLETMRRESVRSLKDDWVRARFDLAVDVQAEWWNIPIYP